LRQDYQREASLSLPDGAEYWWPTYNIPKDFLKNKRKYPPHDCKPRGGPKGTFRRRFCNVCNKAFKKREVSL